MTDNWRETSADRPEVPLESESPLSWDHRDELGFARALFATIGELFFRPWDMFGAAKEEDDVAGAILYALIVGTFSLFVAHLGGVIMHSPTVFGRPGQDMLIDWIITRLLTYRIFFNPMLAATFAVLSAAVAHFIIKNPKSPISFQHTLRPIAYVFANTTLILALPAILSVPRAAVFLIACVKNLNRAPDRFYLAYTVPFTDRLYDYCILASAVAGCVYFALASTSAIGRTHALQRWLWGEFRVFLIFIGVCILTAFWMLTSFPLFRFFR